MKTRNIARLRLVLSIVVLGALALSIKLMMNQPASAQQEDANRQAARTPAATAPQARSIDDMFADVARLVPTFGGFFLGEDGRLNVYLLNTAHLPEAMQAIVAVFGREQLPIENPVALQGRYNFTQLKAWHDAHQRGTLAMPGVSFTDIDEMNNRLEIGVTSFNAKMQVREALNRLGISEEAANISEVAPMQEMQTLQSKWRPIAGGIQIRRSGQAGNCTLGFLGIVQKKAGFITNSHCTNVFGTNDSVVITQANSNNSNRIGVELFDPALWTGGPCPSGRLCRQSDAAFIARDGGVDQPNPLVDGDFGYLLIADTPNLDVPQKYKITSRAEFSIAGEYVEKVGRTTGRTKGKITNTCANSNPVDPNGNDTGRTMICQNRVAGISAGGDSGAPVFSLETWPGGFTGVRLHGILWGGSGQGNNQTFSYSGLWYVDQDLQAAGAGKLKVFDGDNPSSVPMVKIRKPSNNSTVGLDGDSIVNFDANAVDYEDNDLHFEWISSVDGALGYGKNIPFTFTTPGPRTVTVTVKDDEGLTKQDAITVIVEPNTPPKMKINNPAMNQQFYTGVTYNFTGESYDPNEAGSILPCSSLAWTSKKAGSVTTVALGNGCGVPAKFLTAGDYTITLKGTDSHGGTGTASVNIKLVAPPASGPPVVTLISPLDQSFLYGDVPFTLKGIATDPDGKSPLTYKWAVNDNGNYQVIKTGTANNNQQFNTSWTPNLTIPHSCGSHQVTLILTVTDADGETKMIQRTIFIGYGPC